MDVRWRVADVEAAVLFGAVRVSKVWVALAVLAAEAVTLGCLVGVRVWDWVGGVPIGQ